MKASNTDEKFEALKYEKWLREKYIKHIIARR
jgi:hypothetical protein